VDHLLWLDPVTILMKLKHELDGLNYELVSPIEIAPALAKWDFNRKLIRVGDVTFVDANGPKSEGRARFSIFHEVIHALSGDQGALNRLNTRSDIPQYARKLRALETRTDKVTAAFMAPRHLICEHWSAREVAFFFGMSDESAGFRIDEIRGRARVARKVPDAVTRLLSELNRGSRG
jgi:Zn-dependent peptidase ImmA (M78 family)